MLYTFVESVMRALECEYIDNPTINLRAPHKLVDKVRGVELMISRVAIKTSD